MLAVHHFFPLSFIFDGKWIYRYFYIPFVKVFKQPCIVYVCEREREGKIVCVCSCTCTLLDTVVEGFSQIDDTFIFSMHFDLGKNSFEKTILFLVYWS